MKQGVKRALRALGLELRRVERSASPAASAQPSPANPVRPWESDPDFLALAAAAGERTLIDPVRLHLLWQLARGARDLAGDAAEVGVFRGGSALVLARTLLGPGPGAGAGGGGRGGEGERELLLFDTFAGMPPADAARDHHREGDFAGTALAEVQDFLGPDPRIVYRPGRFPATAGADSARRFALVHVDADLYRSVHDACVFFYPRVVAGGVLVFDDYGFLTCPGARQAVDEFFAATPERPLYLPTGQAVVVRR